MADRIPPSPTTHYVEEQRDPLALIAAGKNLLEAQRELIVSGPRWDAHQLESAQRSLILLETIVKRLRLVMAMQAGPAEGQDWEGVEQRAGEIERRRRTVRGAS